VSIRLDPSLYEDAALEQEVRRREDPMEVLVRKAFGDITGRIAITEAWQVLGIQGRVLTQDEMQRFGNAMRSRRTPRPSLTSAARSRLKYRPRPTAHAARRQPLGAADTTL
jgi:hypothetical protein